MTRKSDKSGGQNKEIRELRQIIESLLKQDEVRSEQFKEIIRRQRLFERELQRLAATTSGIGETVGTLYDLHASLLIKVDALQAEQSDVTDKLDPLIEVVDGLIRDRGKR